MTLKNMIHNFKIYSINKLKLTTINKIKSYINNKNNSRIGYKSIAFILKQNKLQCENYKINKDIEKYIIDIITENKLIIIKDIVKKINKKFNIILSESSVYNVLKKNKITYKKVKVKTNPYTEEEQKEKILGVKGVLQFLDIDNIASYDEISAITNKYPIRGWCKKGEECIINNKNTLYGKRFTIGVTVDTQKLINFKIVEGGMKTDTFIDLLKDYQDNYNNKNEKTLFLDNASVHHTKKFKAFAKETKIHALFNVPYNSEKNPIEYVFSLLRKVLEKSMFQTMEDLTVIMNDFKQNISSISLNNIFEHAFSLF